MVLRKKRKNEDDFEADYLAEAYEFIEQNFDEPDKTLLEYIDENVEEEDQQKVLQFLCEVRKKRAKRKVELISLLGNLRALQAEDKKTPKRSEELAAILRKKDFMKNLKAFIKKCSFAPPALWYGISGEALYESGEYEKSITVFEEGLKSADPIFQGRLLFHLAKAYTFAEKFVKGLDALERAIRLNPSLKEDAKNDTTIQLLLAKKKKKL